MMSNNPLGSSSGFQPMAHASLTTTHHLHQATSTDANHDDVPPTVLIPPSEETLKEKEHEPNQDGMIHSKEISSSSSTVTKTTTTETTTVPQLPPADPEARGIPRITLGETIRFEELGPIIINSDGTTRRIDNWDQMTQREREVTWRRISKRNEERRKILLEQQQQEQHQQQQQQQQQQSKET